MHHASIISQANCSVSLAYVSRGEVFFKHLLTGAIFFIQPALTCAEEKLVLQDDVPASGDNRASVSHLRV